jgi:hypothetical protein
MGAWFAAHRKAIAGAVTGAVGAAVAAFTQGGDWRAVLAALAGGAVLGGFGVSWSPANKPKAA